MKTDDNLPCPSLLRRIYPWVIELWLGYVLLTFFLIRILGSSVGQRILVLLRLHRSQ